MEMCTFRSTILYNFWILVQIKATCNKKNERECRWSDDAYVLLEVRIFNLIDYFFYVMLFFPSVFCSRGAYNRSNNNHNNNNKQKWTESKQMEFLSNTLNFNVTRCEL